MSTRLERYIEQQLGEKQAEIDRLRAANAGLMEALRKVDRELKVPAAEYVPAISAVWDIIDAALAAAGAED